MTHPKLRFTVGQLAHVITTPFHLPARADLQCGDTHVRHVARTGTVTLNNRMQFMLNSDGLHWLGHPEYGFMLSNVPAYVRDDRGNPVRPNRLCIDKE